MLEIIIPLPIPKSLKVFAEKIELECDFIFDIPTTQLETFSNISEIFDEVENVEDVSLVEVLSLDASYSVSISILLYAMYK